MKILFILFCALPLVVLGQNPLHMKYDWSKVPAKYELTEKEKAKDEIVVFEKRSFEFFSPEKELLEYSLLHRIVILNTDKAIEENNKFYISKDPSSNYLVLKARVIKPSGDIIEVSEKNIQKTVDEDGNIRNHYFAFEGLEIGSAIEFLQYVQDETNLTGTRITVQTDTDKKNIEFEVVYPNFLEFQFLSINGLPELIKDEKDTTRNRMYLALDEMPGLADEDWSATEANVKKFYYKLARNKSTGKGNFYTYTEVSKLVYADMFAPLDKKGKKSVQKFIDDNTKGISGNKEKIRAVEDAMKSTISVIDGRFEGSDDIPQILSKKFTNDKGMTKLMLNCLREMQIPFELVLTSDRTVEPFIEDFQAYLFLQEYMIYINETDQYFSSGLVTRAGFPPYEYTENKGLFITEVVVNDYATSVGKVKYIKGLKYEASIDQIDTEVNFTDDLSGCTVQLTRINTGYKAMQNQPILDFLDDEQKKSVKEDYLKYLDEDAILEDMVFENANSKDFGIKPFIGKAKVISQKFTERAGDKILLKVGLLIGPQAQMYNQKERVSPVDSYYSRGYDRTIIINIPENYEVKNPDDLNFDYAPEAKSSLGFRSTYKIEGNKIIVTVKEWYASHAFSLEDYSKYEKTINMAADFNKVVLVLQKKM